MPRIVVPRYNKLINRLSRKQIDRYVEDKRFKRAMTYSRYLNLNKNHYIPYISGYSKDAKTIYLDKNLNTLFERIDITEYIVWREFAEKNLIDLFRLPSIVATYIANLLEYSMLNGRVNYTRYIKFINQQIKRIDISRLNNIPNDLDMSGYINEPNYHILKRIIKNGR